MATRSFTSPRSPTSRQPAARHTRAGVARRLSLDALVVTSAVNIRYLSNHAGSAGILVLTRDGVHLLVDFIAMQCGCFRSRLPHAPGCAPGMPASWLTRRCWRVLQKSVVHLVGFEAAHVTVSKHDWWQRTSASRDLGITGSTERVVEQARLIKDTAEIETLREAARRLSDVATAAFAGAARASANATSQAPSSRRCVPGGQERVAFDTIVGSGPNAALPHYRAGDRLLSSGDLVVLDFGGVLDGYCCDLTPTSHRSGHRQRRPVNCMQQSSTHSVPLAAVRPGVETSAVDAAARRILEEHGLGAAFGHGTGHGLGLDIHEEPRITWPRPDVPSVMRSLQGWSLRSNQAPTSLALAACGSRTTCW